MLKIKKSYLRATILFFYFCIVAIIVPLSITRGIVECFNLRYFTKTAITGAIALLSLPICLFLIVQHLLYYSKPKLQKYIIGILFIIPIYSLCAWFNFMELHRVFANNVRVCYEAYAFYCFLKLLLNYLQECYSDIDGILQKKPQVSHIFPLCFLENWKMGRDLVNNCRYGILQYTIIKPLLVLLSLILRKWRYYEYGYFADKISGISQIVALYCFFLFYRATKEELAPLKPVGKFLCIKVVMLFSCVQLYIINSIEGRVIPCTSIRMNFYFFDYGEHFHYFLLCCELLIAAVAFYYYYSVDYYAKLSSGRKSWKEVFYTLGNFSDSDSDDDKIPDKVDPKPNIMANYTVDEDWGKKIPLPGDFI